MWVFLGEASRGIGALSEEDGGPPWWGAGLLQPVIRPRGRRRPLAPLSSHPPADLWRRLLPLDGAWHHQGPGLSGLWAQPGPPPTPDVPGPSTCRRQMAGCLSFHHHASQFPVINFSTYVWMDQLIYSCCLAFPSAKTRVLPVAGQPTGRCASSELSECRQQLRAEPPPRRTAGEETQPLVKPEANADLQSLSSRPQGLAHASGLRLPGRQGLWLFITRQRPVTHRPIKRLHFPANKTVHGAK